MNEIETTSSEDSLAKFVQKAKRKLNKKANDKEKAKIALIKPIKVVYEYKQINQENEYLKFLEKVKQMLAKNASCINPIELLGGNEIKQLRGEQKTRFVLKLSKLYNRALIDLK